MIRRFGVLAVLAAAFGLAQGAQAMEMTVVGDQLTLSGLVQSGDIRRFEAAVVSANEKITTVILKDSNGGDANAGYTIGERIRERGLTTALSGYCISSCSRMFLGGVRRMISDGQTVGRTYVAFHGNYADGGNLINVEKLRAWVTKHLDGKADAELVDRWTSIPTRNGSMRFYHPDLNRKDKTSVFLCMGQEKTKPSDCEHIKKNGYEVGVFTSKDVVHVKTQ
jgi:hypothetical protein